MITSTIQFHPFIVPNSVVQVMPPGLRQDGFQAAPSHPLMDLAPGALSDLCEQFRKDVFERAGQPVPPGCDQLLDIIADLLDPAEEGIRNCESDANDGVSGAQDTLDGYYETVQRAKEILSFHGRALT